jgi:O-antigen/teichoic acid export membrane protein
VIGVVGGLVVVGAYRGGETLLGPINILVFAVGIAVVPEGVRLLGRSSKPEHALLRAALLVSTALTLISVMWGSIILLTPDTMGAQLLGDTWTDARAIVVPLTVAFSGIAATSGAFFGLRSLAAASRGLRARIAIAIFGLGLGTIGVAIDDARGAAIGVAIGWWIGAGVSWYQFVRALDDSRRARTAGDTNEAEPPGGSTAVITTAGTT